MNDGKDTNKQGRKNGISVGMSYFITLTTAGVYK
jgi:hypothetical protein